MGLASVSVMHLPPNGVSFLVSCSLLAADLFKYKRFSNESFAAITNKSVKRFWFWFLPLSPVHVGK